MYVVYLYSLMFSEVLESMAWNFIYVGKLSTIISLNISFVSFSHSLTIEIGISITNSGVMQFDIDLIAHAYSILFFNFFLLCILISIFLSSRSHIPFLDVLNLMVSLSKEFFISVIVVFHF